MSAYSGAPGFEVLSASHQRDRAAGTLADTGLAPRPSPAPPHLSLVLSVPLPTDDARPLPLHDVTAAYHQAVHRSPLGGDSSDVLGAAPLGSRLWTIRLAALADALPDIRADAARYEVLPGEPGKQTLRRLSDNSEVTIDLSGATDDFALVVRGRTIRVEPSFPVPDTVSAAGTSRHPFYTFTRAAGDAPPRRQWRVEPLETGPLRYVLHATAGGGGGGGGGGGPVRAVYHHTGQAPSLSLCDGRGVLLLPAHAADDDEEEAVTVASLLGLLGRVRGLQVKPLPTAEVAEEEKKKSILQRLF